MIHPHISTAMKRLTQVIP